MTFDDLDAKMRRFETSHDYHVVPGVHIVVRLDGRGFTRLTKEKHSFEAPFDERFRDWMVQTVLHLMQCGPQFRYGYTQSDEISLLLHEDDNAFGRKTRKLVSVLAGEASARFSLLLGDVACFDARVCELPSASTVIDYFRWRQEDAGRNALNAHCYWMLRRQGESAAAATAFLSGKSVSEKNEFLFGHNINFTTLPSWQRRGTGVWWADVEKAGTDPRTGESVTVTRKRLVPELSLPYRDEYAALIQDLLSAEGMPPHRPSPAAKSASPPAHGPA